MMVALQWDHLQAMCMCWLTSHTVGRLEQIKPGLLANRSTVLPGYSQQGYSQKFLSGDLHIRQNPNGLPSYFGSATYTGGWSQPQSQTLFFCGNFSTSSALQPSPDYVQANTPEQISGAGTITWPYSPLRGPDFAKRPIPRSYYDVYSYAGSGMGVGALFSWRRSGMNATAEHSIESRIGISYISDAQACHNVAKELPPSTGFEDVVSHMHSSPCYPTATVIVASETIDSSRTIRLGVFVAQEIC